jgi:hypothetical protein
LEKTTIKTFVVDEVTKLLEWYWIKTIFNIKICIISDKFKGLKWLMPNLEVKRNFQNFL